MAGGESRRFGRDKASEIVGGQPLLARAAETLGEEFSRVIVVSSRAPATGAWPQVPDLRTEMGPLAGIEAALTHAAELGLAGVFILACDLPLVDVEAVRAVVQALDPFVLAAAPERAVTPHVEPLCAGYRVACLEPVRRALDAGVLAVHRLFVEVGGVTVSLPEELLLNVNRPADAGRAEDALRHRNP